MFVSLWAQRIWIQSISQQESQILKLMYSKDGFPKENLVDRVLELTEKSSSIQLYQHEMGSINEQRKDSVQQPYTLYPKVCVQYIAISCTMHESKIHFNCLYKITLNLNMFFIYYKIRCLYILKYSINFLLYNI